MSFFPWISIGSIAILTAGITWLYFNQTKLLYMPFLPPKSKTDVPSPKEYGIPYEDARLHVRDGPLLENYFLLQPESIRKSRPTIVYFHGQAGNIGHRLPIARAFYLHPEIKANVFMVSYRGYGRSTGTPSEEGLNLDAETVLDYLKGRQDIDTDNIVLYGTSLGGAVAISLAANNQARLKAMILENTFTAIADMLPVLLPILRPFAFLSTQIWPSEKKIKQLNSIPILFISGELDEIVPPVQMQRLFKACQCDNDLKQMIVISNGHHNDCVLDPEYFTHVARFLNQHNAN